MFELFYCKCVACDCMYDRDHRCIAPINFTRGQYKLSLLLFNNAYNPVAYATYFGAVNTDIFNDFICKDLAPNNG